MEELWLYVLNVLVLIDCFCVILTLMCSLRGITCLFMYIGENLPRSFFEILKTPLKTREISKFQKSEFGKFIPNFPLNYVITSTNLNK